MSILAGDGPPRTADAVARATAAAERAASAAGVCVRQLGGLAEFDESIRLYHAVWHIDEASPPVTRDLLRALSVSGSYVAGAFDDEGIVAASFTVFHPPGEQAMHSHIVGVAPRGLGRGVGFALKLDQRAWALSRGVTTITWTFDPLVRRNAYFNLVKLAAGAAVYFPDFYGQMGDELNGGDASDRLLIAWELLAPRVLAACAGERAAMTPADRRRIAVGVGISAAERPVSGTLGGALTAVAVPADIEAMRRADPGLASEWRLVVREALGTLLGAGGRVVGFDRELGYLVEAAGSSSA